MGIVEKMEMVMLGVIALLIIATFLNSMSSDLNTALSNSTTQPNGTVTLAIIGFIVLAFAVKILIDVFKRDDDIPPQYGQQ